MFQKLSIHEILEHVAVNATHDISYCFPQYTIIRHQIPIRQSCICSFERVSLRRLQFHSRFEYEDCPFAALDALRLRRLQFQQRIIHVELRTSQAQKASILYQRFQSEKHAFVALNVSVSEGSNFLTKRQFYIKDFNQKIMHLWL